MSHERLQKGTWLLVRPVRRLLNRTSSHILLRNSMWYGPHFSKWCTSQVRQPVLPVHVHDRCCLLCQSRPSLCFSVDKAQQSFCQPWLQPPAWSVGSQRLGVGFICLSRSQFLRLTVRHHSACNTQACLFINLAICVEAQQTPLWVRGRTSNCHFAG